MSKVYGRAALRIDFGIVQPDITDLLQRSAQLTRDCYRQLPQVFDELGLEYVPSFGNCVLVKGATMSKLAPGSIWRC